MPWVKFKKKFNWRPKPSVIVEFKAGSEVFVTRRCAENAVAAKAGELTPRPRVASQDAQKPLPAPSTPENPLPPVSEPVGGS